MGVLAKHWTPGLSKTRLAATLGQQSAAKVAKLLLETTLNRLGERGDCRLLAFAPADKSNDFKTLEQASVWDVTPQPDGSLGDRMRWFFERAFGTGCEAALLFGADSPDLPLDAVDRARELLTREERPVRTVLGPTDDGGYWMVGARGEPPPIFGDLPWSTPRLLDATLRRLSEAGWREGRDYERLRPWYDVDTEQDLRELRSRIRAASEPSLERLARSLDELLDD